jgi:hypothetical protein
MAGPSWNYVLKFIITGETKARRLSHSSHTGAQQATPGWESPPFSFD